MIKAKTFHFDGYQISGNNKELRFKYRIEFSNRKPLKFIDKVILPRATKKIRQKEMKKFLEPLSLIQGISYYKLYCPPKIESKFKLSKEQVDFWNIVYRKGLGEFLYRNKLDPKKVAKFPVSKNIKTNAVSMLVENKLLLGIGGGKDSIVANALLKDFDVTAFLIETQKEDVVAEEVVRQMNHSLLKIKRELDPKIFEKHEDSYNGHIPISAIFAFLGLLSAALYKYKYFVVANEYSSNFGNLNYQGEIINHQWSKSMEFEQLLQNYTRKFITSDITYFSVLRQFNEIRIAKMFSKQQKLFPYFASCNRNFRIHKERPKILWCGKCAKCVFTFLILSPFLAKKDLIKIFNKNLFVDENLLPLFRDLLGFGKSKPFDCVGTFEESRVALLLASRKYHNDFIVKAFVLKVNNFKVLMEKVFKTNFAQTLPTSFRFLGIKTVGILGYGKEGEVTKKYLKKNYPSLKIKILDKQFDKKYLKKQSECDLIVRSPGTSKDKVIVPYVTATNIFFSQISNFTIGVTGTKGKSTTASLIYSILKEAGKKVRLVGNIGNPMLEVLLTKVDPKEIFVVELSSYMLDDIEYSPNIAILLNLFLEHVDYHGSFENYYQTKKNIFKFQKSGDIAIKFPFKTKLPADKSKIPLVGTHNLKNVKAAVQVARELKIKDSVIKKAIVNFKPLPHRLELVGEFQGVQFYDDANSAIPESTIEAIKALKKVDTIFLGGEDRGYDFFELEKVLKKYKVKNVVLFPDTGKRMLRLRKGFNILETKSMKQAVDFAYKYTEGGKICLLSMASPSYSLWKNFEEKGDLFQKCVKEWIKK